ncbi:hypothetical protein [Alkaliphilus crotonatoxidans]
MYNKFLVELKPLIKITVISLASIVMGFDTNFSTFFFLYCITLFILPICIKGGNLSIKMKFFIAVSVGITSVLAINYLIGRHRIFYSYIVLYVLVVSYSIASNVRAKP